MSARPQARGSDPVDPAGPFEPVAALAPPEALEEEPGRSLSDYLDVLRRRKLALFVPGVLVFAAAVVVAFALPAVYRSSASILIEAQEIPQDLVRSTVSSFADQRIQTISQRVMSTANLSDLVERLNLYPELLEQQGLDAVLTQLREDIYFERESAEVTDPRSGRRRQATIAFTVAYESALPGVAQRVASELVSLYLEENLKTRARAATDTTQFLENEAEKLGAELSEMEERISAFKTEYMGRLPDQISLNVEFLQSTEDEIRETQRQIMSLEDRMILLDAAIGQAERASTEDPLAPERRGAPEDTPASRLDELQDSYLQLVIAKTQKHPDVIETRRELRALEAELGDLASRPVVTARLARRRAELAQVLDRYAADHPDVRKLRLEITELEETLAGMPAAGTAQAASAAPSASPDTIELRTRRQSTENELASLIQREEALRAKRAVYEKHLLEAPEVERKYTLLVRDREAMLEKYHEIKNNQSGARVAESLEKDRKGERFSLLEPPRRPTRPAKPNRKKVVILGLAGAMASSLGTVALLEALQNVVRGVRGVIALTGSPPLATIPYMDCATDCRRRRLRRRLVVATMLTALLATLAAVHLLVMPLDVVWFTLLERIDELKARHLPSP